MLVSQQAVDAWHATEGRRSARPWSKLYKQLEKWVRMKSSSKCGVGVVGNQDICVHAGNIFIAAW